VVNTTNPKKTIINQSESWFCDNEAPVSEEKYNWIINYPDSLHFLFALITFITRGKPD